MTATDNILNQCDDAITLAFEAEATAWTDNHDGYHLAWIATQAIRPIIDKLVPPDVPTPKAAHDDTPKLVESIDGKVLYADSLTPSELAFAVAGALRGIGLQARHLVIDGIVLSLPADRATIARLNGQLTEADATIDRLQQQLAESDKRIRMFRQQVRGLNRALDDQRVILKKRTKEVKALQDQLTELKPAGDEPKRYPYDDGGFLVLGPECFKAPCGTAIAHKGEWFYRRPEHLKLTEEVIETTAKAAYQVFDKINARTWQQSTDKCREIYRAETRAALTAGLHALGFNIEEEDQ